VGPGRVLDLLSRAERRGRSHPRGTSVPLRCIYCGFCEEVCPEEAIFMSKAYAVVGHSRELMTFDEQKLYEKLVLLEASHVSGR
jgi:formate hydrogenlyase subunit 6/NADH:ubiquinone oxidoreductase subunit I